jgi:hypothetical protein
MRIKRRTTMARKLTLGLVAAASLGAIALAPSAASAKPWGGGWGGGYGGGWGGYHHHYHGPHFGIGLVSASDAGCYVTRRIATRHGYRFRTINVCD